MENSVKSFTLFVRADEESQQIANSIRELNTSLSNPLTESDNGDLVIAIGGDGTFIDAVTSMNFSKEKIYTGVHKGTLGFLQDLSEQDIYSLLQYIQHEKELRVRKVYVSLIKVFLKDGKILSFFSLNEVLLVGESYSKISFSEYVNGELLQRVSGNGIVIATSTGDTAYNLNANGAIDFSNNFQLVCTLETPIRNAAFEKFITNPIVCSKINIVFEPSKKICVIIDGIKRNIDSEMIKNVEVSMVDDSNYINKLDLVRFSKVKVIRNKILGY